MTFTGKSEWAVYDQSRENSQYDRRGIGGWLYPLVAGTEGIPFCPGCEACGELLDEGFIPEEMCVGCLVAYLRQEDEN